MIHYMCVFSLPRIQHQLQDNARIRVRAREKTHGIMDQLSKAHLESSTCHRLPSKFLSLFFFNALPKKKKKQKQHFTPNCATQSHLSTCARSKNESVRTCAHTHTQRSGAPRESQQSAYAGQQVSVALTPFPKGCCCFCASLPFFFSSAHNCVVISSPMAPLSV